jgi:AraC-like DNA-binding protein
MGAAAQAGDAAGPVRSEFTTTDPQQAHEWIQAAFSEYETRLRGERPDFRFRGVQTDFGGYTLSRLRFPMTDDLTIRDMRVIVVLQVFSGEYGFRTPDLSALGRGGDVVLFPYQREMEVFWSEMDIGAVTLRPEDVARVASETTGIAPHDLVFDGGMPISADAEKHWRSIVSVARRTVEGNPHAAGSPLIRDELARMLAVSMLSSFANTSLGRSPHHLPDGMGPSSLRRAVQYVDDHAHEALTLTEIAAAAGVGPRALQLAFRRTYDTTPLGYLRRVRLEHAHRELVAGDPARGDSVAAIAARWGFGHPGRFSALHARTFGDTPLNALRS